MYLLKGRVIAVNDHRTLLDGLAAVAVNDTSF